jgi:hypothetical protein
MSHRNSRRLCRLALADFDGVCFYLKTALDASGESARIPSEMNTITTFLTTNSPLLNLSAGKTALVIALVALGAFYAGRLTARAARWALAL